VARAWRAAAADPRLWRTLALRDNGALTDAIFAALVQRAGGSGDDDDETLFFERIDVRGCARLTARGVVAALRDKRVAGELLVRGVTCSDHEAPALLQPAAADGAVLAALQRCLAAHLDVVALCRGVLDDEHDRSRCARLCSVDDLVCDTCALHLCETCAHAEHSFALCGHLCASCHNADDALDVCAMCAEDEETAAHAYCGGCLVDCDDCDKTFCLEHGGNDDLLVKCDFCATRSYCAYCAEKYNRTRPREFFEDRMCSACFNPGPAFGSRHEDWE
jgi:hypothetical protein